MFFAFFTFRLLLAAVTHSFFFAVHGVSRISFFRYDLSDDWLAPHSSDLFRKK
jgi:hypothetical protein